jgi:hypothetical protein
MLLKRTCRFLCVVENIVDDYKVKNFDTALR